MANYSCSQIRDHLGILGFTFYSSSTYTFDRHTFSLFYTESKTFQWGPSSSQGLTDNLSTFDGLVDINMRALGTSAMCNSSNYIFSYLKKVRDYTGINAFIPTVAALGSIYTPYQCWLANERSITPASYAMYKTGSGSTTNYGSKTLLKRMLIIVDMNYPFIRRYGRPHAGSGSTMMMIQRGTNDYYIEED